MWPSFVELSHVMTMLADAREVTSMSTKFWKSIFCFAHSTVLPLNSGAISWIMKQSLLTNGV